MHNQVTRVLVNVVPFLIGGVMTFLGGHLAVWLEHRRSRKSLACAIAGEVASILLIIKKRQYLIRLEQMIALQSASVEPLQYKFSVKYNYFEVFQANAGKIGDLPARFAEPVVSFYTIAKALLEDANAPKGLLQRDLSLAILTEQRDLLRELIGLGEQIVQDLTGQLRPHLA